MANVQWELYRAVDTNPDFGGYKLAEMNQRIFNVTEVINFGINNDKYYK